MVSDSSEGEALEVIKIFPSFFLSSSPGPKLFSSRVFWTTWTKVFFFVACPNNAKKTSACLKTHFFSYAEKILENEVVFHVAVQRCFPLKWKRLLFSSGPSINIEWANPLEKSLSLFRITGFLSDTLFFKANENESKCVVWQLKWKIIAFSPITVEFQPEKESKQNHRKSKMKRKYCGPFGKANMVYENEMLAWTRKANQHGLTWNAYRVTTWRTVPIRRGNVRVVLEITSSCFWVF